MRSPNEKQRSLAEKPFFPVDTPFFLAGMQCGVLRCRQLKYNIETVA